VILPSEFQLLLACCRWPPSPSRDALVRERAADGIDWEAFRKMVARHRVEGLVHNALTAASIEIPAELAAWLAAESSQTARENLLFAAEALRLSRALADAGIAHLFVKGVTLSLLGYGSLALKRACDIDLAVEPERYVEAAGLLAAAGLQCVAPAGGSGDGEALLAWSERNKHTIWAGRGVLVELHRALVDTPLLLSEVSVRSPRQMVEIAAGVSLPTLAREELFAYLCVHGGTHGWSRLKWLADVAALLSREPAEAIEPLYRRSLELGAGRTGGQALLLSSELLGLALPPALQRELKTDRALAYLSRVALRTMLRGGGVRELDDMAFGTADIHLSHFRLMPGLKFKWAEARRKLAGPADDEPLPFLLQPILAAPRWLLRRARRSRGAA
jgi:hypothetical protein